MATRNTDVNLIIRARNEAGTAITSVAEALKGLVSGADTAGEGVGGLAERIAKLDKTYAGLADRTNAVREATSRQAQDLHSGNTAIQERRDLIATLSAGLEKMKAQADKGFVGPRSDGLAQQIKLTQARINEAERDLRKLTAGYQNNLGTVREGRSTLLELSNAATAVAEAQEAARAAMAATTTEIERQNRAAAVNRNIRSSQYQDSGKSAEMSADVFARAGLTATEKQINAAEELAAKERLTTAELQKQAELRRNAAAGQAIRSSQYQDSGKSAEMSAGVFAAHGETIYEKKLAQDARDAAAAEADLVEEARRLLNTIDPIGEAQERYNRSIARLKVLRDADKISALEMAAAEIHLRKELDNTTAAINKSKTGGKINLFGLKPYELQNLSYQINDVVTGIASGQHFTQILAQQGGQILQLFPKAGGAILGALTNPGVLAGVASIGVLALSIKSAADNAERLRGITAQLNFRANGGLYDATKLADTQRHLEAVGVSAKDAQGALKAFLDNSIAPDKINQFTRAAKATADIMGTDLPAAASEVATAFTGGYQAIATFDDKLNFLTGTQREHIRTLFEQGKAEQARTEALNIYSQKAEDTASKQRGPWGSAALALKNAWDAMITSLSNTSFAQGAVDAINKIADAAKRGADNVRDFFKAQSAAQTLTAKTEVDNQLAALSARKQQGAPDDATINGRTYKQLEQDILGAVDAYNKLAKVSGDPTLTYDKQHRAAIWGMAGAAGSADTTTDDPNSPKMKDRADKLTDIALEKELDELRRKGEKGLTSADTKRREALAGEIAFRKEMKATGDAIVADAERSKAVSLETLQANQQNAAAVKAARAERESSIGRFERRIVGAEGGNRPNAAGSSAGGYGQFTEGTYLSMFKRLYPDTKLNEKQILETRYQEKIATAIIDAYTRDNAAVLDKMKLPVNGGNLYSLHMFGNTPLGRAVLTNDGAPMDELVNRYGGKNAGTILSQNRGYLRTEGGKGRYRSAKEMRTFLGAKTGDISTDDTAGEAQRQGILSLDKILADQVQKQEAFNTSVKEGNDERLRSITALKAEAGLTGTALLDAQRKAAMDKAEFDLRRRVIDLNKNREPGAPEITVSDAQVTETRNLAGALHDSENAATRLRAKLDDVQRPTDELREQIDLLKQQADFLRSIGENKAAETIDKQIDALNPKLSDAIEKLIEFYKALTPEERVELGIVDDAQLDNIIAKLEQAKQGTKEWGKVAGVSAKDIAQAFASTSAQAFTNFLQKVSQGKNVFKSLGEAVLEFAANFAMAIAQMILQILAYAAVVAVLKALGVQVPSFLSGGGAGQHHSGGIAGQMGGHSRVMPFNIMAGARRYHTGGIAGLRPDEVPAILRRGEEVLTENDPRHRNNGGGADGGAGAGVSVILVSSPEDALKKALEQPGGQRVLIKHVSDNAGTYNAALGRG